MGSQLNRELVDPNNTVSKFVKVLKAIEKFAKKGSEEHKKGNHALGHFYNFCTLILSCLVVIIAIVVIYGIGSLLPKNLQWITVLVLLIPVVSLYYFASKTLNNSS